MAVNPILNNVSNAYQSNSEDKQAKSDALGRDAFLTMLIAQLKNQDPLNPMEGTEFSSQLAQFSQLEQLMNIDESLKGMNGGGDQTTATNPMMYLNKMVTGNVDTMQLQQGNASAGIFRLSEPAEIRVAVVDSEGKTVRTMNLGTKVPGNHTFSWDGMDTEGNQMADGTYTYKVLANTGTGFQELPTSVSGKVDGVVYESGKPYLVVQGVLMDIQSLTTVMDNTDTGEVQNPDTVLQYLGKTVSSDTPIVSVEEGAVKDKELTFHLAAKEIVTIKIFDSSNNVVKTVNLSGDDVNAGDNTYSWDGVDEKGNGVPDGLYRYEVTTPSGSGVTTPISGEVVGIQNINGKSFLQLEGTGRLVSPTLLTSILK